MEKDSPFQVLDQNGDGEISVEELKENLPALCELLFPPAMQTSMMPEDVDAFMREHDRDGDGKLSFDEFIAMFASKAVGALEKMARIEEDMAVIAKGVSVMMSMFRLADRDGDEKLDRAELQKLTKVLVKMIRAGMAIDGNSRPAVEGVDDAIAAAVVDEVLKVYDTDKDGKLSFNEAVLACMMTGPAL